MNKEKWFKKAGMNLLIAVFSPLIIIGLIIIGIYSLFDLPKSKKKYKRSRYYADIKRKFSSSVTNSYEYRFYDSAVKRGLPIEYHKQESNGLEFFIYEGTLFLFSDFYEFYYSEEKSAWMVGWYSDEEEFLSDHFASLVSKLDTNYGYPVKVLVEKEMFSESKPEISSLPDSLFLIGCYEQAFNEDDLRIRMVIPQNTMELYQLMAQEPNLCGTFELSQDSETIKWRLDNMLFDLSVGKRDCYIGAYKPGNVITEKEITHWHPVLEDIFCEVCRIGKSGNISVLRSFFGGGAVMYSGPKNECPYWPPKKHWFSKYYYIEAE